LHSKDWKLKRQQVFAKYGIKCWFCGRKPKSLKSLHIHHEEYSMNLFAVSILKLKPVCARCHKRKENEKSRLQPLEQTDGQQSELEQAAARYL
jgi:5-methylcytosine-specific restriction endonuclease McrA